MGDCILLKERVRTSENEARPGSSTWISACDKIQKCHVSLISARRLHLSISTQILRDDSAESGEPSLGMRNSHRLFLAPRFFLTLWTRGSVAEEYLIPPDNLEGRDDRPLLLRVWQECMIKAAVFLCRKRYCFRERAYNRKITKNVYSLKKQESSFCFAHFSFLCLHDASTWMQFLVIFPKDNWYFYTFQWPAMKLRKVKNRKHWILM